MEKLLEFHGTECPHCRNMDRLVERLEEETGVKIKKYEVWHDETNAKLMEEYDKELCGGVPFFYNAETKRFICGETDYEDLKRWASSPS